MNLPRIGVGLALAGMVGVGVVRHLLRNPLPAIEGRREVKGLEGNVEIIRDRWGVPHVYAHSLADLMFAFGYVQAQDRLWQMEFHRRLGSGTLSEVVGRQALEVDRLNRCLGFRRLAERYWCEASDEERLALDAFSAGVNAHIEQGSLPVEFNLLRYQPNRWLPTDTITFSRFMAWNLTGNWDGEILRSWMIERFGTDIAAELTPNYPLGAPLIIPPGTQAHGGGPSLEDEFMKGSQFIGVPGPGQSNSWAVDGQKSITGSPLLANDPHLPLSMPSIWYEAHLVAPDLTVAGVCLPGTPGILVGHNKRIAWGITAALADGDDLFVERINPEEPNQYEYDQKWVSAEIVQEKIKIRGSKEPVIENVMVTRHGPVISGCIAGEERTLSLRSTALGPVWQGDSILLLMTAGNWQQFREALRSWPAPVQNFVYADVEGNIGYQLAGRVPIRRKGYGMVPSPGWCADYEWAGFVPFDEMPSVSNPTCHWVATANNKIVGDDYPYFLGCNYADGYRQQRITDLLNRKIQFSVDDFRAIQLDLYSIAGRVFADHILGLVVPDSLCRRAQNFVKVWDGELAPDSVAATVVQAFFVNLLRLTLVEKTGSFSDYLLGRGIHIVRSNGSFFLHAASWLSEKIDSQPNWFAQKNWQDVMTEAFVNGVEELQSLLGPDPSRWRWGAVHIQTLRHPLAHLPGLTHIFNRGPIPRGGDANTICQAAYTPSMDYRADSWAVSYRQIIDLSDFNNSVAVVPGGQSGHPGSRHYDDLLEMWRHGQYHPMPWDRDQVEAVAEGRLLLEPVLGSIWKTE